MDIYWTHLARLFACCALLLLTGCKSSGAVINPPRTPTPAALHVTISGRVDRPFTLTAEDLDDYPQYGRASIMICPDGAYETEEATWQGVLLADLFAAAGVQPGATKFTVYSDFDGYKQTFLLDELEDSDIFLAITKDHRPMTFHEGAPARIVAHGRVDLRWVRWVSGITIE